MLAMQRALAGTKVLPDYIRLSGGLDEVTPPYERKTGLARSMLNYEANIRPGYRRTAGYERTDGRARPSDAQYSILTVNITGAVAAGDTITGATSGATAVVLAVVTSETPNYLVITRVTLAFEAAETLNISAAPQAVTLDTATAGGASTLLLNAVYKNMAADNYRASIAAVPGSGNVLGVVEFQDVKYAFRNNAGGTATEVYKSSASGWTAVPLGRQLSFTSGGTTAIEEGDTITGATSGSTAVVTRVVLTSGTWAAGTAAGKLIFASQSAAFQAENLDVGASPNVATIAGDSAAITLLPGGRYEFEIENFGGDINTLRVYGCDGVNKGFEFDGTVYVPIDTGMDDDAPEHLYVHKMQLFYSFGSSVQHCAPTQPYVWSPIVGASELGMGDTVTGFAAQTGTADGGALAIFTRNRLSILYGSGVANWNLVPYRKEVGAYAHTIQDVGYTIFQDDRGITDLQNSQNYGNFAHSAISDQIKNTMDALRITSVASCVSRVRSQYRLFFSSGYAIYVTLVGRKVAGITLMLLAHIPTCMWSGERNDGSEAIYFGDADGFVYEMERGTSFDGDDIEAYFNLAYNFQGTPRQEKHYRDCTLEVEGGSYTTFYFGYSLGYGATTIPQPEPQTVTVELVQAEWDTDAFTWDVFTWDGESLSPSVMDISGDGENISIAVTSSSDLHEPYTISSALLNYTPRGRLRP